MSQAIISRRELEMLINDALAQCASCTGADMKGIYLHEPDELGCNWMIRTDSAAGHSGCLEEISPRIHHLRMRYNLPDPAEELAGHPT
ncbi:MAG: hypothetical protein KGL40_07035 [Rhodocyclaceae bacterium]|nr:hypothetical protein [Rhodocyclaceae bacterium]